MEELEPTWGRAFRVWWLILWRSTLGSLAIGALIGLIVPFLHLSNDTIAAGSPILGLIIGLFWWVMVTRMALRKKYSDFRIALLPRVD